MGDNHPIIIYPVGKGSEDLTDATPSGWGDKNKVLKREEAWKWLILSFLRGQGQTGTDENMYNLFLTFEMSQYC